jgi:hypothetical protein
MEESIVLLAAEATHTLNKLWCEYNGDFSQPDWEDAPEWQRDSAIDGVKKVRDGTAKTPQDQHQSWMDLKVSQGWVYGPVKDPIAKTHPCLVPYDQLSDADRRKDHLFRAVVKALTEAV